jgi:hypothetical protein
MVGAATSTEFCSANAHSLLNWSAISTPIHRATPLLVPSKAGSQETERLPVRLTLTGAACLERSKYQEDKCQKQVRMPHQRMARCRLGWADHAGPDRRVVPVLQRVLRAERSKREHAKLPETVVVKVSGPDRCLIPY